MSLSNYLPSDYQTFIATSRYARWLPDEQRRETWLETVDRFVANIVYPVIEQLEDYEDETDALLAELRDAIVNLEVMPSMRALMTAGEAADRDNTCIYNCSYLPVDIPGHSMRPCSSCYAARV